MLEKAPLTQSHAVVVYNAIYNVDADNGTPATHVEKHTLNTNHINLTNSGEVTGKSVEDYIIVPGAKPDFNALSISLHWRLKRYKRVVIKPGETYIHTMSFKPFCIDDQFYESIARINPFRTRKLIVCAFGEKVAVDAADFATSGSAEINRKMKCYGQFRAMPYVKRRQDIVMGSGGVDVYTSTPSIHHQLN
jgi:hypothetical protein